jgi:hypothetical protein
MRELELVKGMVWRVGDGRGPKIWSHPWLPRSHTRRPIAPRSRTLMMDVDELISHIRAPPPIILKANLKVVTKK